MGLGMQPGYWRTWMTGVRWHSSQTASPAVSKTNNKKADILEMYHYLGWVLILMIWISQPHKTIYYVQLVQLFRQYLTFLRFYICLKNHLIDLVGRNNARDATCDQPTVVRTDWQRLGWAVVLYRNTYPLCPAWSSTPLVITVTLSLRSHYRPCWAKHCMLYDDLEFNNNKSTVDCINN